MASAGPSNTTSSIIEIRPPSPAVPRSSRGGEPIQQQATSPPASRRQGRIAVPDKDVIERLGRQRPAIFGSTISELGFCFSLLASAFLAVGHHPSRGT